MDKNGSLIVLLFLFMIFLDRSNALNSRKLVTTSDPNGSSNANQDSSLPSPRPNEKTQNLSRMTNPSPMTNPSDVESKGLNDTNNKTSSENSSDKKVDNSESQDDSEKVKNENKSKTIASKSCNGNPICSDQKKIMSACIQDFDGSNNLTLIIQNERDMTMKVSLTLMTSVNNSLPALEIPGRGIEKVNITFSGDKSTKLILNAGNGDCELQIGAVKTTKAAVDSPSKSNDTKDSKPADTPTKPKEADDNPSKSPKDINAPIKPPKDVNPPVKPPKEINDPTSVDDTQSNLMDQLSFYSKQVTPIYGAYFAFVVALIIGGSWAFCSMRKRRSDGGGVPYQELEMGNATTTTATTEEGWDQDWDDDDWDEDKAIRSPGGGGPKTISSNGLTSRPTKKDEWDAHWDD